MSIRPAPAHVQHAADVRSFLSARFDAEINAVCLPRDLTGDFDAVARALAEPLSAQSLPANFSARTFRARTAHMTGAAAEAVRQILSDADMIARGGRAATVYLMRRSTTPDFHADTAFNTAATVICTYTGATTEYTENASVIGFAPNDGNAEVRKDAVIHSVPRGALWKHAVTNAHGIMPLAHRSPHVRPDDAGPPRIVLLGSMR